MGRTPRVLVAAAILAVFSTVACSFILDVDPPPSPPAPAEEDGAAPEPFAEAGSPDAGAE